MDTSDIDNNTPDILVNNSVLLKIAKNTPSGHRGKRIAQAARNKNIPVVLLFAIYGIEMSFRPCWVQIAEDGYLCIYVAWWLITGRGFRDITVGSFQIGCHVVADYAGAEYYRKGDCWYPKRSLKLAYELLCLPFFKYNLKYTSYRISLLWQKALESKFGFNYAVYEVGRKYNGSEQYGLLLLDLISIIKAC